MPANTLNQRLARRCAHAMLAAFDAFPDYLARSEPHEAAAVIAEIIKAQITLPESTADAGDALAEVIRRATQAELAERDS